MTSTPEFDPTQQASDGLNGPAQHPGDFSSPETHPLSPGGVAADHTETQHLPEVLAQQAAPQYAAAAPSLEPATHLPAGQSEHQEQTPATAHPTSRSGALVAGIAIGALLGGLVGGGTAAIVAANQPQHAVSSVAASGTLTLNRSEDVSRVSAVAAQATPSVVTLQVSGNSGAGSGSGVIYSSDGYIVTNNHVVTLDGAAGGSPSIRVRLSDGRIFDGKIVGTDPFSDLAVVKIEASSLVPIAMGDSTRVNVGDLAIAIGAPLNLANTVTSGVVSALYRGIAVGTASLPDNGRQQENGDGSENGNSTEPWDFRFGNPGNGQQGQSQQQSAATAVVTLPVIQTDASINPGNSGGALLNENAELIGINVAIADNSGSPSTAGSDGLGFAIPANFVHRVAASLIAGKQPTHGLFGASVGDAGRATGSSRTGGLLSALTPGGAADRAGLRDGDIITAIDGIPVDSGTTASALVRMHEGGSEVTVSYLRNDVVSDVQVTLGTLGG